MNHPEELRYARTHEWVRADGDTATIGITDYAQEELGDIVYLELPTVGTPLQQQQVFGTVESVKAASDLYAPVTGAVIEINEELPESPEELNQDPYVRGWMIIVRMEDASELEGLMSAAQYEEFISSQ
jgi:glycine cleavage system H protein